MAASSSPGSTPGTWTTHVHEDTSSWRELPPGSRIAGGHHVDTVGQHRADVSGQLGGVHRLVEGDVEVLGDRLAPGG